MVRRRVIVTGLVQGVGFRWWTRHEAQARGLAGYVRNRSDGTVEAELEGEETSVAGMIEWLRHGPEYAEVAGVEVTELDPTGRPGFSLRG